ncbi:MAG: ABC transporter ATP-binding protein [Hyphomicrobiales bacterium]|nr:MAG: ABC transporter ATP-binding protein [Hyphomicrobiales bacterium]
MSTSSLAPLLDVAELKVGYGRIEAVRGISLKVGPGEFVGVVGSNGAGKSSTMRAIAGSVRPASGRIALAGADVTFLPSHAKVHRGIAMVPEGRMIFGNQTVRDNLILGAYARVGKDAKGVEEDTERVLALFPRLRERLDQMGASLSGGEQQMLAIARGLLSRPKVLIIDELSLGLAPKIIEQLFPVLVALNKQGLAILLVEQMASFALAFTQRTYVMENGEVMLEGPSADLAKDKRVVAAYLGKH